MENYKYTFNRRKLPLQNGLYIAIPALHCSVYYYTDAKGSPLLTWQCIEYPQQASLRMFLALGVAGD